MKRAFDARSMDKLDAAQSILDFLNLNAPDLESSAQCFLTASALRLAADLLSADKDSFSAEYAIIRAVLCWKRFFNQRNLTLRHRALLFIFLVSPRLYQVVWRERLKGSMEAS